MKSIEEVLRSTSVIELDAEWKERAALKARMVGWLYPSILQSEMTDIQKRLSKIISRRYVGVHGEDYGE